MLNVGDAAPDFEGTDHLGRKVRLHALLESGPVVLYFYPKDFTWLCTKQACLFRDAHHAFTDRGAQLLGVSVDNEGTHRRFAEKHELPFPLLDDSARNIARNYDVLHFFDLFARRVTYLIGRSANVEGVFHHEFSAAKHLNDIREALARLG